MIVEFPISDLFGVAAPEIEIRLVPDFKIPAADLVDAVTGNEMPREFDDEPVPFAPIFGRRDVRFVPEWMGHIPGGEFFGHETQLHERPHAVGQQAVVNLVHIRKIINRLALVILIVNADFVVENGVEPDVIESGNRFDFAQVPPVIVA